MKRKSEHINFLISLLSCIRNALNFTQISLKYHFTIYYTEKMHVLYQYESNVELPHPTPLTRPKLLSYALAMGHIIISLHIKSTSNHIKRFICANKAISANLGDKTLCNSQRGCRAKLVSMQRGYNHQQGILNTYIYSRELAGENKTTTARMLQGQGQWKGNIKVIEAKGQGYFAIYWSKGTIFTINDLVVLNWGKMGQMVKEKHHIIDKV